MPSSCARARHNEEVIGARHLSAVNARNRSQGAMFRIGVGGDEVGRPAWRSCESAHRDRPVWLPVSVTSNITGASLRRGREKEQRVQPGQTRYGVTERLRHAAPTRFGLRRQSMVTDVRRISDESRTPAVAIRKSYGGVVSVEHDCTRLLPHRQARSRQQRSDRIDIDGYGAHPAIQR